MVASPPLTRRVLRACRPPCVQEATIKRLRFLFRVEPVPKAGFTRGSSGARYSQLLDDFRPRAERYRRRKLIARSLLAGAILGIVVLAATGTGGLLAVYGAVFFVVCGFMSCLILAFGLRLACPACRKRLEPAKGPYCPVCGSDQFRYGSHISGPSLSRYAYCPSCDSKIDEGAGDLPRSYRIRGCTHCGVMLDEEGL